MAETVMPSNVQQDRVVNNLTTTAAGYVLDARQGKALSDQIADKLSGVLIYALINSISLPFTLKVPDSSRHVVIMNGPYSGRGRGIALINANTSSVTQGVMVGGDDNFVISTATGEVTFGTSSSSATSVNVAVITTSGNKVTLKTT